MDEVDPDREVPGSTRPRTPMLLWVIVFVVVVMMVVWGMRNRGTRSSAEPGAAPAAGGQP
jgi:hypothetical protein